MANPNYIAGRRFEYERAKYYREVLKHSVCRTAGSHGLFDLITISPMGDTSFIQCKRVSTAAEARRLISDFKTNPPLGYRERARYHQIIDVRVKGSKEVHSVCI